MEYRSLFDTDTDTLLNELSSSTNTTQTNDQQQQQQNSTTSTQNTTSQMYQSSQTYNPNAQNMYHTNQMNQSGQPNQAHNNNMMSHHHQMNYMSQQTQYYPNQQMMQPLKTQPYMHTGPINGQQPPPQQQQPPPPGANPQQPNPQQAQNNSTTIQNVQINVQNNFNIGKTIQQASMNQFSQSNVQTQPQATTQPPWSQYTSQPNQQYPKQQQQQPVLMPQIPQNQQQTANNFNKMNQFNQNPKPSPPPQSQPGVPQVVQQQTSQNYQMPPPGQQQYQAQNIKMMTHSAQIPQQQTPSNYNPMQMGYNPQTAQQQSKLSSLPPHMQQQQQPYNAYPNQQQTPVNTQPRPQLMPNQYQASPNKIQQNIPTGANMYQSSTGVVAQQQPQQTSPNQNNYYQNNPQQSQYNQYYQNSYQNPQAPYGVMNATPARMTAPYPNYTNNNVQLPVQNQTPEADKTQVSPNSESPQSGNGGDSTPTKRGRGKGKSKNSNSDNSSPNNEDENSAKPKKRNSKSKLNSSFDKSGIDTSQTGSPSVTPNVPLQSSVTVQYPPAQQPSRPPSQQPFHYANPSQSPSSINRVPLPNNMPMNTPQNMYPNPAMYQKPPGYLTPQMPTQMNPQMPPQPNTQIPPVMPSQVTPQMNPQMAPFPQQVYNQNAYPMMNGAQYTAPQQQQVPPQQLIKPQIPVQNMPQQMPQQVYPQQIPLQKPPEAFPPMPQTNGYPIPVQAAPDPSQVTMVPVIQTVSASYQAPPNGLEQQVQPGFYPNQIDLPQDPAKTSPKKQSTEKKVRKIRPKKDAGSNDTSINNDTSEGVSASTQSKIDATIDDFMKKYKMKDLSDSESEEKTDNDDKKDSDFKEENSQSDNEVKKAKKPRGGGRKKKNLDLLGLSQDEETVEAPLIEGEVKKKRKYTKKKNKLLQSDELSQSNLEGSDSLTVHQIANNDEDDGDDKKSKIKKESSFVVSSGRGRRRSAFVKLMQKNKRKKRKKTSSDEDGVSEDDSDDFELSPAVVSRAKKEEIQSNHEETNGLDDLQSDEAAAKLLQANEKRRSTRCVKRQKYADSAIKDEDLLLPVNDNEPEEEPIVEKKGNIEFANSDTLVVDKILGIRLFKRKTKRKVEKKKPEEKKETPEAEVKVEEEKKEEKMELETTVNEENKENLDEVKKEDEKIETEEKKEETLVEEDEEVSEYETDGEVEVEEFYVKYKSLSYLHCEWRTRDELFYSDKRIDQKIKRFRLKKQQSQVYDWDEAETNNGYNNDYDELFNPDYNVIDRILDEYETDDLQRPGEKLRYFLVKWKALAYDESSWELESDVKNLKKIERFRQINTLNPEVHLKHGIRPKSDRWNRLPESRVYKNNNRIRDYQLEGINWMIFCWLNGRNCILADEMGLGKTVQSITFLQEVAYYGVRGPHLILVPLSTIGNWIREFETWTDFNVIVYHGSTVSRQMIQDYEFYFKETESKKKIVKFDALITTYEVLMSDVPLFCSFKWRNLIIDEAHRLKNKNCKLIEGLRFMDIEHKVLLTGTPLQNNVEELFSLLNFLEPQQFHSSVEFMNEFGDLKTDTQVQKLQALLKPMMLRRLKEDVEKNLKPKEETIVEVELTNTQKKYYRAILEKNFQFLSRGASGSNVPNLMNTMMELRKCCNHPYLIDGAEDQIIAEHMERYKIESHDKANLQAMVQASGKLVLVDKLLPKLKAGGHRVLIFSQMIRVLDILEDYLIQMRFTYERLDGRIRGEARQEAIDRYSKPDSDRFAFLLCTRAGGLGINLTAADTVIIYDSDWNPQNDLQAQARVHRIGQQKSVKIYRLITRNTYEREMFDKASLKLGLDKAILQSMRNEDKFNAAANANNTQLTKKEIEDLLKKGAYGAIMEDDNAGDTFCEEDIDKILQQRSTVIQIEGGEKGSTFSKASFQTSETNDISIDDPEFWQKWAKKAEIDIEEKLNPKDERIIYEPRRRTQTRRYGGPDDVMDDSEYSSSDSDENKDQSKQDKKKGKKRRGRPGTGDDATFKGYSDEDEDSSVWSREECYKVEKLLLIYGWSRWSKILNNLELSSKRRGAQVQTEQDVENLSRTIIAYTVKNYTGDESIKQFIVELIDPSKSNFADLKNHHGLAAPVARGRRPRPPQTESHDNHETDMEWAKNAEELLGDENYKKHLNKQANKILLRLRMLFYIQSEILGEEYASRLDQDNPDLNYESVDLALPDVQFDLPADWWDRSCDNSILLGVYKHGFEKYNQIRSDPKLCFLTLCGPPDDKDLLAEQQDENNDENNDLEVDDREVKPKEETSCNQSGKYKKFPTVSELNNRLRRLIATVQKYKKQEQLMSKRNAERQEKRLSKLAVNQERAQAKQAEKQSKWSRREEQNFYKTISSYGVDCIDKDNLIFAWDKFRELGQLDKKLDDTLTDYYLSFVYMCKKVCHKLTDDDNAPVIEVPVELITEDRAARCLQRIEMMNKIRLEILKNENFEEVMSGCPASPDLPDWYIPGKHDKELVKAASRHGLARTEYYYYNDPEFSFKNDLTVYTRHIEKLMDEENKNVEGENLQVDPIQYFLQNQTKIQTTFKALFEPKSEKLEEKQVEVKEEKIEETKDEPEAKEESNDESKIEIDENEKSEVIDTSQKELVIDETESSPTKKLDKSETEMEVDKPKTPENGKPDEEEVKEEPKAEEKPDEPKQEPKIDEPKEEKVVKEEKIEDDKEPTNYFQPGVVPVILWPKDRVILNRLENIITFFETNEWPQQKFYPNGLLPSASNSQLSLTNPFSITNLVQSPSVYMNDNCSVDEDDDNMSHENDPDYYSKNGKPKRGRPPKYDQFGMKNLEAIDENSTANKFLEPGEVLRPKPSRSKTQIDSENSDASSSSSSTKLSKKPKRPVQKDTGHQGIMNPADLAALAALFMVPGQDPDERITVINMEDGTRLTGSKAPKRCELPMWLISHPNYLPDEQEIINMTLKNSALAALQTQSLGEQMKKMEQETPSRPESTASSIHQSPSTRSKSTPQTPQQSDSPLLLYNKASNKRINSAKVPPFKHLASFLEKNEQIHIEPSCNDLIRSKFGNKIPDIVKSRMSKPKPSTKPPQSNSSQPSPATTPKPNGLQPKSKPTPKPANPFSPSNLNDLLGAGGGLDLNNLSNNPLAGFMAAALAGQSNPGSSGLTFNNSSGFNPFLLPPFGATGLPGMPGLNPMDLFKDFSKLPPGLDMGSLDEFSAQLAALQNLQNMHGMSQASSAQSSPAIKPEQKTKDPKMLNKKLPDKHDVKKTPKPNLNASTSSYTSEKETRDPKPSTPVFNKTQESKQRDLKTPKETRNESKPSQKSSSKQEQKSTSNQNPDFSALAAAMSQFDPTNPNNLTALASMMEQDKFLQEMMNFSQFNPALANNPFLFSAAGGASPFAAPVIPPVTSSGHGSSKSSKNRSPSPNPDRAHSLSPALSASSNLSSAQQAHNMEMANNMDFNFLMNNLMNFGAGTGAGGFPPGLLPPPPFGLPGADLSKLPVELLTALSAAATQSGGLDPSMFSALAQLNSLSNNVTVDEKSKNGSKTPKPTSSGTSSKIPVKTQGNGVNRSGKSSTPMSSNGKKREIDDQGLDLSIKKSSKNESDSVSSKRVRQSDD